MSQQENLRIVQEIYDAVGRGDVAAILDRVTDDVDWSAEAASHAAPWYGPRTGRTGVASFFGDLADSIEITRVHPAQLRRRTRRCAPAGPVDVPVDHHLPAGIDDHAPLLAPPRRQDRAVPRQRRHRADSPGPDPGPDADPEFIRPYSAQVRHGASDDAPTPAKPAESVQSCAPIRRMRPRLARRAVLC